MASSARRQQQHQQLRQLTARQQLWRWLAQACFSSEASEVSHRQCGAWGQALASSVGSGSTGDFMAAVAAALEEARLFASGPKGVFSFRLAVQLVSSVSVRDFIWGGRPLFLLLTTYLAGVLKAAGASQNWASVLLCFGTSEGWNTFPWGVGSAATVLLGSCQQVRFSQRRQDGRVSAAVFQQAPSSSTLRFLA